MKQRLHEAAKQLSDKLLPDSDPHEQRLDEACWHVQNALDGEPRLRPLTTRAARAAHRMYVRHDSFTVHVTAAFCALSAFEPPLWCLRASQRGSPGLCPGESPHLYPSFELPMLPHGANLAVECAFVLALLLELAAVTVAVGGAAFRDRLQLGRAVVIGLYVADLSYAYATPITWWRAAAYLRAALHLLHSRALRSQLLVVLRAARGFAHVAALLLVTLLFAGWLATVVFPPTTREGREVTPNVTEAVWQLLILLTTANFPDVMMPAYESNRCAVLFFLACVTRANPRLRLVSHLCIAWRP